MCPIEFGHFCCFNWGHNYRFNYLKNQPGEDLVVAPLARRYHEVF